MPFEHVLGEAGGEGGPPAHVEPESVAVGEQALRVQEVTRVLVEIKRF